MDNVFPAPSIFKRNHFTNILFWIVVCDLLVILISLKYSVEVLAAILGISILYIISNNSLLGISSLILLHYFTIRGTEEITPMEVIYGISFLGIVGYWLFDRIFLRKEKVLADWLDYSVAAFIAFAVLSIIPAILFGSSLSQWARELIPLTTFLLLFVVVDHVRTKRKTMIILGCFLILGLSIAIEKLVNYKMALSDVIQFWEIAASRQALNESLLMASVIMSSSFIVLSKSRFSRMVAVVITSIFGVALILTFSRGFWMATALSLGAMFLVMPWIHKRRFMLYVLTGGIFSLLVALFLFGELAIFVFNSLTDRFLTIGDVANDLSLANRVAESNSVVNLISQNPVVGYGLGKLYSYKALIPAEMPTFYVHNTLLFFWFKLGIFGVTLLTIVVAGLIRRAFLCYRSETDMFMKTIYLGIMAYLVGVCSVSFTSLQFLEKDSALVIAFMGGIVQSGWYRLRPRT